jgi:hypothetical protein
MPNPLSQRAADDTTPPDAGSARRRVPLRWVADLPAARLMARRLRWMVSDATEPTEAQWETMGQALWRGDPLADDVVDWIREVGMARAWSLFEQAIQQGDAPDQPPALRRFVAATRTWPAWVDPQRMALGARVLQSTGLHGMMVLRDAGLMAGYQASAINQTLVMTGSLQKGAQRRVAETTSWWLACIDDEGMQPGAPGHMMTLRVRIMHALVRRQLLGRADWDAEKLGVPVNQVDMQATYLAFSVVQLLALKTTGLWLTRRESDAVMHLWRYIGWLMGVEASLLCDDESEGRRMLYHNVLGQAPADDTSVALARALMDEPLQRHYPNLPRLRGLLNRARHQSLVSWFVGSNGLRALGLPAAWPWYPLLMAVPLALRSTLLHAVPPLGEAWRRHAREVQRRYLDVLMGAHRAGHLTGHSPHGMNRAG